MSPIAQLLSPQQSRSNLSRPALIEHALKRKEGVLVAGGALAADTGRFTGRSPRDRFIVLEPLTQDTVDWGEVNQVLSEEAFNTLKRDMFSHAEDKELFTQDLCAGTDPEYQLPVRIVSEYAWHSLFARNMFVRAAPQARASKASDTGFCVLCLPGFQADPKRHDCVSETIIAISLSQRLVLIGGTEYSGEIKKSIFSVLNFSLPDAGVLPMHCSANVDKNGCSALFFGLSGTGKTTLSATAGRSLIGDDEHGWSASGIFNFEGGCYAKVVNLTPKSEPEIHGATRRFGAILENVVVDRHSRTVDFNDISKTQNTRASYPLDFIPEASSTGRAGHPKNVIFLTADAFGVLPPIAKLSPEGAVYHFLSGYTAKVAGTERGVFEPSATFSACFGVPFMPRSPAVYARLLGERLRAHGTDVWLINTGWYGGAYGVGQRIALEHTRAMVRAALSGILNRSDFVKHPVFNVAVPTACAGVPTELLTPRLSWQDEAAYDVQAQSLAARFKDNFKQYAAPDAIKEAGPL